MKDLATKNTKDTKKVWPKVRLGDLCEFVRRGKSPVYCESSHFPMFAQKCNQPHGIVLDKCKFCEPEKYLKVGDEYRLRENDIVVNSTGTGTLGRVGLFRAEYLRPYGYESIVPDSHVMIVRANEKIVSPYLYLYVKQGWVYQWINDNANGSTNQKELYPQTLVELLVPLPPLSVQREIVARLEKELGEADKLAAKFKRVAELADDAFKAELDETFKTLEDNSRRGAEARRVRLGDVCEFVRNGANIKQRKGAAGIPITRIETLSGGVFNSQKVGYADIMNKEPFEKHIVGIGDLLISHINSAQFVGRTVMYRGEINGPIIHGMNLLRARLLDSGKILPAYVELWFKTISARIYISGVTKKSVNQASVNTTDFKRMPIIRPPISAQRAIIAKLDAAKDRCEKLKAAAMRGLAAAENLRKAILAEAFEQ